MKLKILDTCFSSKKKTVYAENYKKLILSLKKYAKVSPSHSRLFKTKLNCK